MDVRNKNNFRIADIFPWSLIKYLKSNFNVTCKSIENTTTFRVHPVRSYEFTVLSTLSQYNPLSPSIIYKEFLNLFNDQEKEIKLDVKYDEELQKWKIILMSSDENALHNDIRKILESKKYIPQFCLEKSFEYEVGIWNFTFNTSHCSFLGRCPLDYEIVGNSKCLKFVFADNFEDHFKDLKGIEENILDILKGENSKTILNYILNRGYKKVLIPIKKLNDFDRTIFISRFENGGNYLSKKNIFDANVTHSDRYFVYDIVSNSNKSIPYLMNNIPHISVIDTGNMIQHINSSTYNEMNGSIKGDLCPEHTLYYSALNNKCLIFLISEISLNWKNANEFCQNHSYNLLNVENEFMTSLYSKILEKEYISYVFTNINTNSRNNGNSPHLNEPSYMHSDFDYRNLNLLTPFGRHSLKEGPLIKNIICETKSNADTSLHDLSIYLTKIETDESSLCLNFSKKNVLSLNKFPSCYCYPNWNVATKTHIANYDHCDFRVDRRHIGFCQCTAVVLHFKGPSVIYSNKCEFLNKGFNYFVLHILIDNNNTSQHSIKDIKIIEDYLLPNFEKKISCYPSYIHTDYKNSANYNRTSYTFNILCAKSSFIDIENFINDVRTSNIDDFKKITIFVKSSTGCPQSIHNQENVNLTWTNTEGKGIFLPNEPCFRQNGIPAIRKCEGDFITGFSWESFVNECNDNVSNIDNNVYQLLKSNKSKIDILYNVLLKNKSMLSINILYVTADVFSKSEIDEVYSVANVVDTVKLILKSSIKNLTEINLETNSSNKLLASFDDLLIRNNSFLKLSNESKQNSSLLAVFVGKISNDTESKSNIIQIKREENYLSFSFLENYNEDQSSEVMISIPKSLKSSYKEIGYVYKQWQHHLLFDDPSLSKTNQKLVGDVIDITFVDLEIQRSLKNLPDNIKIKIKQERNKNKNYSCVSWSIVEGHWTTDGCTTILSEDDDHYITCVCNHLTHYSILFGENEEEPALNVIVYIGSSISIIALTITIASAILLKHWPITDDCESKSLVNLCVAILGATITLIIGAHQIGNYILCTVFAFILHYFLLSSFCWMTVEAVYKYLTYVKHKSYYLDSKLYNRSFYFSWGIPLIVTLSVVASRFFMSNEPNIPNTCWLLGNEMYYGFLGPLIIFKTFNLIVYIKIIYSFRKMLKDSKLRSNESLKKRHLRVTFEIISLSSLFGLSWIFGLFILMENSSFTKIFIYVFNVLQSLHGFFIVFRIFNNKNLRKEWRYFIKEMQGGNPRQEEFVKKLKKSDEQWIEEDE